MSSSADNGNRNDELWLQTLRWAGQCGDLVSLREAERLEAEIARKKAERAPRLAVDNPDPEPPALLPIAVSRPDITLVVDNDAAGALASDVEALAALAMARIKETLSKPFDPGDANYTALLKFVSSVYGSTMNTLLRADENKLRARAVDRLPELLERVALEERKRAARTIEGTVNDAS